MKCKQREIFWRANLLHISIGTVRLQRNFTEQVMDWIYTNWLEKRNDYAWGNCWISKCYLRRTRYGVLLLLLSLLFFFSCPKTAVCYSVHGFDLNLQWMKSRSTSNGKGKINAANIKPLPYFNLNHKEPLWILKSNNVIQSMCSIVIIIVSIG